MGTCAHCGTQFPKTRTTRKYCTNRCKTNACLTKKPRLKAGEVEALHALLDAEVGSVEEMRERLRSIVAPHSAAGTAVSVDRFFVPRLD